VRILFVSHSSQLYGAERGLYELVKGIAAAGRAEPIVCCPSEGPLPRRLLELGIPVRVVPYAPWASGLVAFRQKLVLLKKYVRAVRDLGRVLDQTAPDLVVTNTATIPSAAFAAYSRALPHVWFVQGYGGRGYDASLHWGSWITWKLVNRLSRRVVVASQGLRGHLSEWIPEDRLGVVYLAAETPPSLSRDASQAFRLVVIGHMVEGKGQEDAVRALAVLQEKGFFPSLTLVGSEQPR
jgi:glycosyltransferase involved in cell wall biosynthesis